MEFIKNYQKTAFVYEEESISYEKLINYSYYYSKYLEINKGDRVLIFSPNRPEFMYSFLGTWLKQGTIIVADYSSSIEEFIYILEDSKPKYILTTVNSEYKIYEILKKISFSLEVIYFEDLVLNRAKMEYKSIEEPEEENIALILYTSGTTGNPKGVMLSYKNIKSQILSLDKYKVFLKEDRFLALLPLHHIFPLLGSVVAPLYFGSTIVFLKDLASDKITDALKKYKITILIGVPRLYDVFHKNIINKINMSKFNTIIFKFSKIIDSITIRRKIFKKIQEAFGGHIKYFVSGGAKLEPEIAEDFDILGFSVLEGYGLTETSPMISFTRPNQIKAGSCGHIIPGIEVKFSEDDELLVKGENVFRGYLNKPQETLEAFTKDGYFKTGDIGYIDKEGFLTITGRIKEMIVLSNGKNINPHDIEIDLLNISKGLIEEVVVIEYDKILRAVIFPNLKKVEELKIQNIYETIKWNILDVYNSTAPKYKRILNLKLVNEEFPKTKLGKIRRFKIKDFFSDENFGRENLKEPEFEEYRILKKYFMEISKKRIYPDSHIELDLGFDSLDMVELNAFVVQNFGLNIDEKIFSSNSTVESFALYIKENGNKVEEFPVEWKEILKINENFKLPSNYLGLIFGKFIGKMIFNTYFIIKKEGNVNLPKEPFILISNHQSFLDVFILVTVIPIKFLIKTYFMAKAKHFKKGFMKFFANNTNIVLVDINQNLGKTLKETAFTLKKGNNMVIFPEGIRTREGELNEFKKSFAILSKELGIPIVPFGIKGAYEAMPFGTKFPKPKIIKVKFFEPIYPSDYNVDEIVEISRNTIELWIKN